MKTQVLCKNCHNYYVFFDDNDSILTEGCHLDIPHFHSRKPVECNSYRDKERRL